MSAAYVPRQLSGGAIRSLNLIAQRLQEGTFDLAGHPYRFAMAPLLVMPPFAAPMSIAVDWGGAKVTLVADASLPELLYGHLFPESVAHALPEELVLAGLNLALGEAMEALERMCGCALHLLRAGAERAPALPEGSHCYGVTLESEALGRAVSMALITDDAGLGRLAQLAYGVRAGPVRPLAPGMPVGLRFEIGSTALATSALRTLRRFDVLILDERIDTPEPVVRVRVGRHHQMRARLREGLVVMENQLEKTLMSATPEQNDAPELAALDDVEVRLHFDLGERHISLGELAAIQPGHVFALDGAWPRLVAIRANGRKIGEGELVKIDERVGVRVLALSQAVHAP